MSNKKWITILEYATHYGVSKKAIEGRILRNTIEWKWGTRPQRLKLVLSDVVKHNLAENTKVKKV